MLFGSRNVLSRTKFHPTLHLQEKEKIMTEFSLSVEPFLECHALPF